MILPVKHFKANMLEEPYTRHAPRVCSRNNTDNKTWCGGKLNVCDSNKSQNNGPIVMDDVYLLSFVRTGKIIANKCIGIIDKTFYDLKVYYKGYILKYVLFQADMGMRYLVLSAIVNFMLSIGRSRRDLRVFCKNKWIALFKKRFFIMRTQK